MHSIISRASTYWRTNPIRRFWRRAIIRLGQRLATRPHLYDFAKLLIAQVPALDRWLRAIVRAEYLSAQALAERIDPVKVADLTPRAHQVYLELLGAIKRLS
ncbi:MAG TPA: hypothetical protein VK442_00385 [Xanthobacteraceae bacterium]|nr:hypothetical protein [Xanthobacteraceae bacterium]